MKQTSTQQNDSELNYDPLIVKDEMYTLFFKEYIQRGVAYFQHLASLPTVTHNLLPPTTIQDFVVRLAVNPSLVTLFSHEEPLRSLEFLITDGCNEMQVRYINDFLDDITINVRVRNEALYFQRLKSLRDQIYISVIRQNGMRNREKALTYALDSSDHNLLAIYYLRKIGFNYEVNRTNRNS